MRRCEVRALFVLLLVPLLWGLGCHHDDDAADDGVDGLVPLDCDPRPTSSDGLHVIHHDGQTFLTWKDQAEGAAGQDIRYDVYRSEEPITDESLPRAVRIAQGVRNNSGKLFGQAFYDADRIDPTRPMTVVEEGGQPLPMWSGLQVHTAVKDACAYYAVVPTMNGTAASAILPGSNATTIAVAERVTARAPIKLYDSNTREGPYIAQTRITGTANLPLRVQLHASNAQGGGAGDYGDYFLYFADTTMGYVDGLPGVYSVQESHTEEQFLQMVNRDTIVNPVGDGGIETYWFGYACVPQWAEAGAPARAYPFTERRLLWMIEQVITRYQVDREHVSCGGGSMGAWGTLAFGIRHPELFAALFPDRPRTRQRGLPQLGTTLDAATALMEDGQTLYVDRMDAVKYATEHTEDLPFIGWGIGRQDGFASWQEQVDFVKAMTAAHHGFAFAWNNGDHSSGTEAIAQVIASYPAEKFALHASYPAFGNSSIDDNLGNGDPLDGDLVGGINLGFDWTVSSDEPATWVASISNTRATAMMTVDVTPRRCQQWKPAPGTTVTYTTSTGQSGTVTVDAAGLVTVPAMTIAPGTATVLTLTK